MEPCSYARCARENGERSHVNGIRREDICSEYERTFQGQTTSRLLTPTRRSDRWLKVEIVARPVRTVAGDKTRRQGVDHIVRQLGEGDCGCL